MECSPAHLHLDHNKTLGQATKMTFTLSRASFQGCGEAWRALVPSSSMWMTMHELLGVRRGELILCRNPHQAWQVKLNAIQVNTDTAGLPTDLLRSCVRHLHFQARSEECPWSCYECFVMEGRIGLAWSPARSRRRNTHRWQVTIAPQ
eukprot:1224409-Amphidinium_carterae.1